MIEWKFDVEKYPTKMIIEDIMDRDGPATDDDWSPFEGQKSELEKQFSGYSKDIFSRVEFLSLKRNGDFDPTKRRPPRARLEDFPDSADSATYFREYCIGYKKHPEGDYVRMKGTKYQPMFEDSDTGEIAPISHFEEEIEEEPDLDNGQIFDRLTYLLRLIWSYSVEYNASLFSFAFAYCQIVDKSPNKLLTRSSFREYADAGKLIRIKNDKSLITFNHASDQKYHLYTDAMDLFIKKTKSLIYNQCVEFCTLLKRIGFDYAKENPWEYTEELCIGAPCLYVDTDIEFIRGAAFLAQINNETNITDVSNKFYEIGIDYAASTTKLHNCKSLFFDTVRADLTELEVTWQDQVRVFLDQMGYSDSVAERVMSILTVKDNFVCMPDGKLLTINANQRCGVILDDATYNFYILDTGDVMAVFLNPATYETKMFYSITRKDRLGYEGIAWSSFE